MKPLPTPANKASRFIDLIKNIADHSSVIRGYEIPSISILLHMEAAPGKFLEVRLDDLADICGLPSSTAGRLLQILSDNGQIMVDAPSERSLRLHLTPDGSEFANRLIEQAELI